MQREHAPLRGRPRTASGPPRPLPPAAALLCLCTSMSAAALGLGGVEVASSLNQPLDARIPLHDVDPAGARALEAGLASRARLREAGLDGARYLGRLRFSVEPGAAGGPYVRVTSREPMAEPFLRFLLRVDTGGGRVIRDYTLLLDPSASATGDPPAAGSPAPAAGPGTDAAPARLRTWGPVATGSSAWEVATAVKPSDASVYQTMLALLRTNPEAFRDGDLGGLEAGARLRVPPPAEVRSIPQERAVAVYREHLGVAESPEEAHAGAADAAAGPLAAVRWPGLSPIRSAAAAQEGAEAGSGGAGEGDAGPRLPVRLNDRLGDIVGSVDAVEARVAAEGERLGRALSSQSGELDRVEQLLSEVHRDVAALRGARPPAASGGRADADGLSYRGSALLALGGLLLGGIAGYAAGRCSAGLPVWRRAARSAEDPAAVAAATDAHDGEPLPAPAGQQRAHEPPAETGDLSGGTADMDISEPEWERARGDPRSSEDEHLFWADIYIGEDLPREAEKIVRDAIALYGERPGYRLKLVEALYSAGAREQYLREATRYRAAAIEEGTWDEVERMGRALAPDHPLFGGDAGDAAVTVAPSGREDAGSGGGADPGDGEDSSIAASGADVELVALDLSELDEAPDDDGDAGAPPWERHGWSEAAGDVEAAPELDLEALGGDPERSPGDADSEERQAGVSASADGDARARGDEDAGDADICGEAGGRG